MARYMFLFRGGDARDLDRSRSPEEWQAHMLKWRSWMAELDRAGKFLGGEPLEAGGAVVAGKARAMTDGPFVEGREIVGGYLVVDAGDLAEAVALSRGCPIFEHDGSVEVRAIQQMNV